jgi:23S rRNA (uracil1939-C5)-methyltransferase
MNLKKDEKYKVNIFDQENEGLGVLKINDMIVFVENGLPGDSGEILITDVKNSFARGKMISFDKISSGRQEAPCPYYDECGGCDLQHQTYQQQLAFKCHKVKNALERIGGFKNISINNIIYNDDFYYRNKVTLKINGNKLGFYKRNTNDIIDIDNCIISNKKINEAIRVLQSFVSKYSDNNFTSIVIRYSDHIMISIISKDNNLANELVAFLSSKLDNLKSLSLNNNVIFGDHYIEEKIDDLTFKLSPMSFYQINNKIMKKLYNKVLEYVSNIENETILDLYCGIGTITLFLSKQVKRVIGIEISEDAIKDARENVKINNSNNIIFIQGKVEEKINSLMDEKIDTIVMDPPRNGIDKQTLNAVMKINPKQIVYVSCNPVTLARDLKILCNEKYNLIEITPFDMFPQTNHVEAVVLMSRVDK